MRQETEMDKTLLERLSENPEVVAEFTREELTQARTDLIEAGAAYVAAIKAGTSEDKKADLEAAGEAKERLEAVNARLAEFEAEDAAALAEATELEEAFAQVPDPDEEEDEEDEPEPEEEPEAEVVEEPEVTEPIAAAAKPSIGAIAKRTPKPVLPKPQGLVASAGPLVAAEYRNGLATPEEIGAAALKAWQSFGKGGKVDAKVVVASFDVKDQYGYTVTGDLDHDSAEVDKMLGDLRNIDLPALTAAATFCAPAQPLYDYYGIGERAGMFTVPTMNATRGRITYRVSPSYADVLANASWATAAGNVYTATEAGEETAKPTFSIVCPDTQTCSVDAYPVILQFGNFTDRFDPETVANAIENTMIFHDHFVNAQEILQAVTASTAQGGGDTGGGGLVNVANLVGFEAAKYRDTYRMSPTATLELVIPFWVVDALAADLVARDSTTSFENAKGRVRSVFAGMDLRVQEVQDWQSIGDADDNGWRTAADFLLYAPGTFVRLDGGSLDLGIVRDSTLNSTNQFQTFMESFSVICEIGHDSWLIDDVTICPRGATANRVTLDCNPGFGS